MEELTKQIFFPESLRYYEYYRDFCLIFEIVEIRQQIKQLGEGLVIEIRTKEGGHNIPHVHARIGNKNVSISLIDCQVLAGNIPLKNQKQAVKWVKEHKSELQLEWENIHGEIYFPVNGKSNIKG